MMQLRGERQSIMIVGRKLLAVAGVLLTVICLGWGQANTNASNPAPGATAKVPTGSTDNAGVAPASVPTPEVTQEAAPNAPQSQGASPTMVAPQGEPSAAAPLRVSVGNS